MKIKKVEVKRLFTVTYEDGNERIFEDTEISDKKLTLKQYLYAIEFNVRHEDISEDSQRMLG